MKYILALLVCCITCFSIAAFTEWNLNPGQWSSDTRSITGVVAGALWIFASAAIFEMEEHL